MTVELPPPGYLDRVRHMASMYRITYYVVAEMVHGKPNWQAIPVGDSALTDCTQEQILAVIKPAPVGEKLLFLGKSEAEVDDFLQQLLR